jgi:cytochrome c2
LHFEHARARFLLDGKHAAVACAACHRIRSGGGVNRDWEFRGRPIQCVACHTGRTG